jgi:hypothetical protein
VYVKLSAIFSQENLKIYENPSLSDQQIIDKFDEISEEKTLIR